MASVISPTSISNTSAIIRNIRGCQWRKYSYVTHVRYGRNSFIPSQSTSFNPESHPCLV